MKTLLIAAGAVALMTGAAFAQTPADTTEPMPAPSATDSTMSTPSTTTSTATAPGGMTTASVQTVTNGPIPDTPENRAKYGAPMSRAGKRTAPVGN